MRLFRHGSPGFEKPGAFDTLGKMRDISEHTTFRHEDLSPGGLAALRRLDLSTMPELPAATRLGPCIPRPGKIICVGLNYYSTMTQLGATRPDAPMISLKPSSAVAGPNDGIVLPKGSSATDWEVELAVVIGTEARYVSVENALSHVVGYCLTNDLSERDHQRSHGGESVKGRGHEGFAPLGPWMLTIDEVPDPQGMELWLKINGQLVQSGTTSDMIWSVAELISHVSDYMTLEPGDVLQTGTPAGIGIAQTPPRYLTAGDTIELGGRGLGTQMSTVRT